MATLTVSNISGLYELVKFQENCYLSSPNLHFSLQEIKFFIQGSLAQVFLRIPSGHYMCPSISPDCHLLVLELVLVLRYHFISSGQINTHRCSMHCAVLSRFSHVQLFVTLWTVAHQLPLSMGFSRQGYWSGLPFPSPRHAHMLISFNNVRLCATLWIAAHQAPLSTGFSRQE